MGMVKTFERVNNVSIPYQIAPRRSGDIDTCYADTKYALEKLNWKAELGLEEMLESAYNYIKNRE